MSDKRLPAEGGDRIDNHPTSSCSRNRGNGRARLEVFGYPVYDSQEDLRLDMTVKRSEEPTLYAKLEAIGKRKRGKYLCINAEIALSIQECSPEKITMDESTAPGAKDVIRVNVRISAIFYPRLYALLKPFSGEKRSKKLQLLASAIHVVNHGH